MKLLFIESDLKTNNNRNEICLEKSFLSMNNENELTKSDEKQTFIDDGITRISLDNDSLPSLSLLNKKKTKTKSIKCMVFLDRSYSTLDRRIHFRKSYYE